MVDEAATCTRCPLYRDATATVFGEGPVPAEIMLVGEQPGDREDRAGHPFVGPAGALLDRCIEEAGGDRSAMYVTNAVKHFKFEERPLDCDLAPVVIATIHPSAILRGPDTAARQAQREMFTDDLRRAADALAAR